MNIIFTKLHISAGLLVFSLATIIPEPIHPAAYRWPKDVQSYASSTQSSLLSKNTASLASGTLQLASTSRRAPARKEVPLSKTALERSKRFVGASGEPILRAELVPICACESSYEGTKYGKPRQFEHGSVLRGYITPEDIGMCQINLTYHGTEATQLGLDVFTEEGNIMFANYLYEREGDDPWFRSERCWGN